MSSPSIHSPPPTVEARGRRPGFLMVLGLVVGVLAFGLAYWSQTHSTRSMLRSPQAELAWLRQEFQLTEDQYARVSALHAAYRPTCAELCRRIADQNRKLEAAAMSTNRMTDEVRALVTETGKVRDECRTAMLRHLYEVASVMPPEAGRRYLGLMLGATCVVDDPRTLDAVHAEGHAAAGAHHVE